METTSVVPEAFEAFFWDVLLEDVDLVHHRRFIIERLLNEGNQHTLRWLFEVYTEDEIKDAVCKSRGLNHKTARFWQYYFHLKEEELRCFGMLSMESDVKY